MNNFKCVQEAPESGLLSFGGMLKLALCPFHLLFKHPFGTTHGVRGGTDSVFARLEQDGVFGYGEATMPPYVPETQGSVISVLSALDLSDIGLPSGLDTLLQRSALLVTSDPCARAALVTAAIDLAGKLLTQPAWQLLDVPQPAPVKAMFTIGLCELDEIPERLAELPPCEVLKVKLNGVEDIVRTETINRLSSSTLFIDINQGWATENEAIAFFNGIGDTDVIGIEQPYPKDDLVMNTWLQSKGWVTVFADESVQVLADMNDRAIGGFGGVNLKLMKCGGLDQARKMALAAKACGQVVMLGSMSESSLGCTAAAHLSGLVEFVDLDGPWLISNDPFAGIGVAKGRLLMPAAPGVGAELKAELHFNPSNPVCA